MSLEMNKINFIEIFKNNIKREGSEKLLDYLINSDFFVAPASTKFHSAVAGGLCEHSLKCYERYKKLLEMEYGSNYNEKISEESVAIIALLHDLCKVNYYKTEMKNVKQENFWIQQPFYTVNDTLPYGHGEKSVYIITGFMRLTREEAMAINWHMGGFDARSQSYSSTISQAFYAYPNALIFHMSDIGATYLDETK